MSKGIGEKEKARLRSLLHTAKLYELNEKDLLLLKRQLEDPLHVLDLIRHVRVSIDAALHGGVRPPLKVKLVDVGRNPCRMSTNYKSSRTDHGKK